MSLWLLLDAHLEKSCTVGNKLDLLNLIIRAHVLIWSALLPQPISRSCLSMCVSLNSGQSEFLRCGGKMFFLLVGKHDTKLEQHLAIKQPHCDTIATKSFKHNKPAMWENSNQSKGNALGEELENLQLAAGRSWLLSPQWENVNVCVCFIDHLE